MSVQNSNFDHLRVYEDRSEYHASKGDIQIFKEGTLSPEARVRTKNIKEALSNNFLEKIIVSLLEENASVNFENISDTTISAIDSLISSVTSEVGRALIGLSVMQLAIKAIDDSQNIRLHKGGVGKNNFSWTEGISMRVLDKKFVTPVLRKHDLLRLNADGFMMTRSLAENYPYTSMYKANIRGARRDWLCLVDEIEISNAAPLPALQYLLLKLINQASTFSDKADKLIECLEEKLNDFSCSNQALKLIEQHIKTSDYAARLLEVSMHALMAVAVEYGTFGEAQLKPLSQMRSANKKHGNVGDIEILEDDEIIIAWDAKYGKGYLREEVEEAVEKVRHHKSVEVVGFVTTSDIERTGEITKRITEIKELHGIDITILSFKEWVQYTFKSIEENTGCSEEDITKSWITNYCSYLCQKRRDIAPIDEPCLKWVDELQQLLD